MTDTISEEEVLSIIQNRAKGHTAAEDNEYDPNTYTDGEVQADYSLYEATTDAAEVAEQKAEVQEQPAISPEAEALKARLAELERENARLRELEEERNYQDFLKRRAELPPEQQAEFTDQYYRERERRLKMENIRQRIEKDYPLASALTGPILASFELEIEDPDVYRQAMEAAEKTYSELIDKLVEERVAKRLAEQNISKQQAWGFMGIGAAAPVPPAPSNPAELASKQYEQLKNQIATSRNMTVDDIQALIRQRAIARARRNLT